MREFSSETIFLIKIFSLIVNTSRQRGMTSSKISFLDFFVYNIWWATGIKTGTPKEIQNLLYFLCDINEIKHSQEDISHKKSLSQT